MWRDLKYLVEYFLVRLAVNIFSLLPWRALPSISRVFGFLAPWFMPARARLVVDNINFALPERGKRDCQKMAQVFWRNISLTMLESFKANSFGVQKIKDCSVLENEEVFRDALEQKKGVLLHTGHFGNWELAGDAITVSGYPLCVLGRKQRNPYVDRWLYHLRTRFGAKILDHHQAVRETQQWLKSNGCLGILMDHNLYKGGIFVDFFGKPAATTTLTALLHLRLGSPIVGVYSYRKNGKHYVRFEKINTEMDRAAAALDRNAQAKILTETLTRKIEDWVREDPANWLWGHNRWKRQPEIY